MIYRSDGYRLAFAVDAVENARCATDFEVLGEPCQVNKTG